MVVIREATPDDLRIIGGIEETLFQQHSYPLFVLRQLFDIANGLFKVAEIDGAIAGYGICHYNPEKAEGWLLSLGVLPAFRGRQIGEKLTTDLTAAMAAKGARTISLTVHPDNTPALKIYERAGFTISGFHPNYYLDHSPRWLLVKSL